MKIQTNKKGFTLIELLIVVAIIAILAAIAIPNFLQAQTRSKVSRNQSDMRTIATALESYFVDNNEYTRDSDSSMDFLDCGPGAIDPSSAIFAQCSNGLLQLTTPVPYIASLPRDPFNRGVAIDGAGSNWYRIGSGTWSYSSPPINSNDHQNADLVFAQVGRQPCFVIIGTGPDGGRCRMGYKNYPFMSLYEGGASTDLLKGHPKCYTDYDPTNGTVSLGDIYRFGGEQNSGRIMRNGAIVGAQTSPGGACW
jgi:prepilin-type N-terminal cleavage/methylation domain-containing protein